MEVEGHCQDGGTKSRSQDITGVSGSGKRCKLPQWGGAPAANDFVAFLNETMETQQLTEHGHKISVFIYFNIEFESNGSCVRSCTIYGSKKWLLAKGA